MTTTMALSDHQREVLELLARGYSVRGVADVLACSPRRVYRNIAAIYNMWAVVTPAGAVVEGLRRRQIAMPPEEEMAPPEYW